MEQRAKLRVSFGDMLWRAAQICIGPTLTSLLLLGPLVTTCSAHAPTDSSVSAQKNEDVRLLESGKLIERDIAVGDSHLYQIALTRGQFLRVSVKERGWVDVRVTLFDPKRQKLVEAGGPNGFPFNTPLSTRGALGHQTLSFVAQLRGAYQLEVSVRESAVPAGRYQMVIDNQGVASEVDQVRAVAEKVYAEAEQLRLKKSNEASQRNALRKYEEALTHWRTLHDAAGEAETLNSIGIVHLNLLNKQEASSYIEQALPLWRSAGDLKGEATTLNNLGQLSASREKAVDYHSQALKLWLINGDRRGEALTFTYMADSYSWLQNKEKTLDCFERALKIWRDIKDRVGERIYRKYTSLIQGA